MYIYKPQVTDEKINLNQVKVLQLLKIVQAFHQCIYFIELHLQHCNIYIHKKTFHVVENFHPLASKSHIYAFFWTILVLVIFYPLPFAFRTEVSVH